MYLFRLCIRTMIDLSRNFLAHTDTKNIWKMEIRRSN